MKKVIAVLFGMLGATMAATAKKEPSIYGDHEPSPEDKLTPYQQQAVVGTLTCLIFVLMATEITSPEVLFLIALCIVIMCEIITLKDGLAGFSNNALITIGSLYLVIGAVERSHVVDWVARKAFGTEGSLTVAKFRLYTTCFLLSIFFNNTPLVAILMPVIKDWCRLRGEAASQFLMPLSFAVLSGSFGSMIGTSTNLTVQGLMQADRNYSFPFFAPTPIGAPLFVLLMFYMVAAGGFILPSNKSGLLRELRDKAGSLVAEVFVSPDSQMVGKTISDMMNLLGIPPGNAIKIRRKTNFSSSTTTTAAIPVSTTAAEEEAGEAPVRRAFPNIFDASYWKKRGPNWSPVPKDAKEDASAGADYIDIIAPPPHEVIAAGDVVFMANAQDVIRKMMKSILGESKGLYILQSDVLQLPGFGTEVIECVVSDTNPFLGRNVADIAQEFSTHYKAAIITVRPKDWAEEEAKLVADAAGSGTNGSEEGSAAEGSAGAAGNYVSVSGVERTLGDRDIEDGGVELQDLNVKAEEVEAAAAPVGESVTAMIDRKKALHISKHNLTYGDTVLCVTDEANAETMAHNSDFFVVSRVGDLPIPMTLYSVIPLIIFLFMLAIAAAEYIDICPAAMTAAAFFFVGGWIKPKDIPEMVDLRLLMLLGCSLSFATSMTKSGLADKIAGTIDDSDPSPFSALLLVYAITLVITELISNNAAAALMYPIAVSLADKLDVSFKPFAMCVLVASTAGFMSPIGYQTHVMVWAPGGYRFRDFVIFGFVPDILYWIVGCLIIRGIYPF